MSTFMNTNKRVVVQSIASDISLQIDTATTVSFNIYERNQGTTISAIDYKLVKLDGRMVSLLQDWTSVSLIDIADGIYIFDITATGVVVTDKLSLIFKVVDEDGIESFREINNIKLIA